MFHLAAKSGGKIKHEIYWGKV